MHGSSPIAQARLREQRRCASIFASKAAAKNPLLAAKLAFNSRMPRADAIAILEGTPAPSDPRNSREARNPNVVTGAYGAPNSKEVIAKTWDKKFAEVSGKKRK